MIDADLLLKGISVLAAGTLGGKLLADVSPSISARRLATRNAVLFSHETRSFRPRLFRIASLLVLYCIRVLALVLTLVAIAAALLLVANALDVPALPTRLRGFVTARSMAVFGGLSVALFLFGQAMLGLEQSVSLSRCAWLFGVAEQRLADRLRRGDDGVFRIDEDRCALLAEQIHAKLRAEPMYISGALLETHPDRARLANELVVGGLLEGVASREHRGFGGDWQDYQPIQNHQFTDRPILSADVVRQTAPRQLATAINAFFAGRGHGLSLTVEGLLEDVLRRIQLDLNGDGSRLFSFAAPPWRQLAYSSVGAAILYGAVAAVFYLAGAKPWPWGGTRCLVMVVQLVALIAVLSVVGTLLRSPGPWLVWLAESLRLVTRFDIVERRLRGLKRFGDREGMRRAQAKFAWEFGLFQANPRHVPLGSQKGLLVSLKTGALVVSGVERVSGADQDLWAFGELTIRTVGDHLRRLYAAVPIYASTQGQYDADNTVDGVLHRVGYKYCQARACAQAVPADDCPFRLANVCDVIRADTTQEWSYERGPNVFSLKDRPAPGAAAPAPGGPPPRVPEPS